MAFPNLEGKHSEDSMVDPKEFMEYRKTQGSYPKFDPPKTMILVYQKDLLSSILEDYKTKKVEGFYADIFLLDEFPGIAVAANFGIGAPIVAALLEEFIAFGINRFVSVGTAGSLQKHLDKGSIVVCDKAVRDEGTSHHYLEPSRFSFPSESLTSSMIGSLKRKGIYPKVGATWTIDAPYRETVAEARHYQEEGILTVEMEASALFAVAEYRSVEIAAVFTISDSLSELVWKPNFHAEETKNGLRIIFQAALEAVFK